MPLAIVCGGCKRKLRIPEKLVGKPVKCPGCARKLKVGGKTVLQTKPKKETVVVTTPKKEAAQANPTAKKPGATAKKPKPPAAQTGSMPKPTFAPPPPVPSRASGSGMLFILGGAGGVVVLLVALGIGYSVFVGFGTPTRPQAKNYLVPDGFDETVGLTWKCTENGSALHFAEQKELDVINSRIHANKQMTWGGTPVTEPVVAVLVRADGKIGYRVDHNVVTNLDFLAALVLDEKVGEPDPHANRK